MVGPDHRVAVADACRPSSPPRRCCPSSASASRGHRRSAQIIDERDELLPRRTRCTCTHRSSSSLILVIALNLLGDSVETPSTRNSPVTPSPRETRSTAPRKGRNTMRLKKPLVALSAVGLLALAACGGSKQQRVNTSTDQHSDIATSWTASAAPGQGPDTQAAGTPDSGRARRAARCHGPADAQPDHHGPDRGLLHQHRLDPERAGHPVADAVRLRPQDQEHDPDPRPGHEPRHAEQRTSRPGRSRSARASSSRTGSRSPLADIKYGIERSFDRATFPGGANYSNQYFLDGDTYKGPYKSRARLQGRHRSTARTSRSRWPSRSRTCRTGARSRP